MHIHDPGLDDCSKSAWLAAQQARCEIVDLHLGKRLRLRRRALQLTQHQLGDAIGVRFQQIQKYECAANRMSATHIWRLASALGVSVSYFFEGLHGDAGPARRDAGP